MVSRPALPRVMELRPGAAFQTLSCPVELSSRREPSTLLLIAPRLLKRSLSTVHSLSTNVSLSTVRSLPTVHSLSTATVVMAPTAALCPETTTLLSLCRRQRLSRMTVSCSWALRSVL